MFNPKHSLLAATISASFFAPLSFADEIFDTSLETDFEVIVISGTKTEKPLKDVAGSISVITGEDIEKQMVTDMSQLFKYDPSVQVSGSAGSAQNFVVRGMGGDRVLMIKDGMRMNEGYGANGLNDVVGRGFIEVDTVKQVEVAKGASSSLYGSDALGGIVVFSTKDASDILEDGETFAGNVKSGYNSLGKQSYIGTTLALETGALEHLLNVTVRSGEEDQNYDKTKPELDIKSSSILYKAKYNIDKKQSLSFIADSWEQDVNGKTAYGLLSYFRTLSGYEILDESNQGKKDNLSLHLRYQSKSSTPVYDLLNVSVYQNTTTQTDVEYGKLDINANFGYPLIEVRDMWKTAVYEQETLGFLSHASLEINEEHTIGYGLDVEKSNSLRTENKLYEVDGVAKSGYPQFNNKFPETDVLRAGIFFNDEISLLDNKLIITPGVRFDRYKMETNGALKPDDTLYRDFDKSNMSFNLAALYKLADTVSVFAQYGQGFKVPAYDLAYLDHDNSIYGYKIKPSEDLSPEKSDTIELGIRGHIDNLFFSSAVFYSKYDDFLETALVDIEKGTNIYTGQETQVLIYQYQNIEAVTIKGIETSLSYHLDDQFSVFANASYTEGTNEETGEYIESISPLSGVTGIRFEDEKLSSEIIVNWANRMSKVNANNVEIAGYAVTDVLTSYQFNEQLRVSVAINNLFDKKYVRYIDGAGHESADTLNDVTKAGRTFTANISYKF